MFAELRLCLCAVALAVAVCVPTRAGTLLNFEDLPDAYFFNSTGQNIGNYYPGVTFGPNVTGLSVTRFGGYADSAFPAHSGEVVIWDASDSSINITFATSLQSFSIWYTSFDPLTMQAFDAGNGLLGTAVGDPNTDGSTGTSSLLALTIPGIQSITLTSTPGFFVLDDLTYTASGDTTPEPSSFALIALGTGLLLGTARGAGRIRSSVMTSCLRKSDRI